MHSNISRFAALLATASLTLPAIAYGETAPKFIDTIDPNGVDLTTVAAFFSMEEGGIGSGPGRISMKRIYAENAGFQDNWSGGLYDVTSGGVTKKYMQFGGISASFTGSGTTWTTEKADGATLTFDGSGNGTYTSRDGSRFLFGATDGYLAFNCPGANNGTCQVPGQIIRPDGTKFNLTWEQADVCVPGNGDPCNVEYFYQRLISVTSSAGYSMTIQYVSNVATGGMAATDPWFTRSQIIFDNAASPANPKPTITYNTPSSTETDVTDSGGRTWVFTTIARGPNRRLAGIRRPGSASDNVTYTYPLFSSAVSSSTKDGIANTYTSSGGVVTMTNPLGQQTVLTIGSNGRPASYKDGLNRTTSYVYDTNSRLTKITAPEGNYVQYTYDARGNITTTTNVAKAGSGLANIVTSASFDATCTNIVKCNKPNTTTDAKSNITNYTYDNTHGGVTAITQPAATNGIRPETRFSYT